MDKKKKASYGGLGAATLCIFAMVALILLVLLLLIIYFSVIKPQDPSLTTDCIQLQSPNPSLAATATSALLASVLCINATLYNPNKAAFAYESVAVSMAYKGRQIGFLMMPGGAARAGASIRFIICLSPGAGQSFLSDAGLQHDAAAYQMVSVTTRVALSGDVTVLGSFSHGTGASSDCIVSISARPQQVVAYTCGGYL